jgi:aryl-alcohol dehydrogenase-like predicted oxidoreductase
MLPIPGTSSGAHVDANVAAAAITLTDRDRVELATMGANR